MVMENFRQILFYGRCVRNILQNEWPTLYLTCRLLQCRLVQNQRFWNETKITRISVICPVYENTAIHDSIGWKLRVGSICSKIQVRCATNLLLVHCSMMAANLHLIGNIGYKVPKLISILQVVCPKWTFDSFLNCTRDCFKTISSSGQLHLASTIVWQFAANR